MNIKLFVLNSLQQNLVAQIIAIISGSSLLRIIFISAIVGFVVGLIKKTLRLAFKVAFIVAILYVFITLIINNI